MPNSLSNRTKIVPSLHASGLEKSSGKREIGIPRSAMSIRIPALSRSPAIDMRSRPDICGSSASSGTNATSPGRMSRRVTAPEASSVISVSSAWFVAAGRFVPSLPLRTTPRANRVSILASRNPALPSSNPRRALMTVLDLPPAIRRRADISCLSRFSRSADRSVRIRHLG